MRYNSSWLISLTPLELADQPYGIGGRLTGLKMAASRLGVSVEARPLGGG